MNWIRNINLSANKTLHLQRWIDLAYIGIFSLSYCVAHGSFLLMAQLVWLAWFEEAKSMCITIFSCIGNSRTKSPTHPHSQHLFCIAECSHSDQSVFFGKKWKSEAVLQACPCAGVFGPQDQTEVLWCKSTNAYIAVTGLSAPTVPHYRFAPVGLQYLLI